MVWEELAGRPTQLCPRQTNTAPPQAQMQDFELAQPSFYLIYERLECMKEPVLGN